jgi:hypothetical protein
MRITWQDKKFDCLALSSFIAQQRTQRGCYDDIPHLVVEVWPPISDRPSDVFSIWRRLQQLRDDFRAAAAAPRGISRFDLVFLENSIASWSDCDGKPSNWMSWIQDLDDYPSPWFNDIECILGLFNRLRNITEAHIYLPDSLLSADGKNMKLRDSAQKAEELMMGNALKWTNRDYLVAYMTEGNYDDKEDILECETAAYARDKLDSMTNYGSLKISEAEYYDFITIWPYLDILNRYPVRGGYKGMWHYTKGRKTENLPPQARRASLLWMLI